MTVEQVHGLRAGDVVVWTKESPPVRGTVVKPLGADLRIRWDDGREMAVFLAYGKDQYLAERLDRVATTS